MTKREEEMGEREAGERREMGCMDRNRRGGEIDRQPDMKMERRIQIRIFVHIKRYKQCVYCVREREREREREKDRKREREREWEGDRMGKGSIERGCIE